MASCLLLNLLPPELRLQIYKHILVRPLDEVCTEIDAAKKSQTAKHASRTAIFRTCRQIYSEAYPVLLSANTWIMRPNREDHTWLFRLGLQGQCSLRKTIFEIDCRYRLRPPTFYFEIFNTLSSHARMSLTIETNTLDLLDLYKYDTMKYMHGFIKATTRDLSNEHGGCMRHVILDPSTVLPQHLLARRNNTWKRLLDQLTSLCPDDCEMHVGRPAPHIQSTVHLNLTHDCFYCEQELKLH